MLGVGQGDNPRQVLSGLVRIEVEVAQLHHAQAVHRLGQPCQSDLAPDRDGFMRLVESAGQHPARYGTSAELKKVAPGKFHQNWCCPLAECCEAG
jgi:hypothetical protein